MLSESLTQNIAILIVASCCRGTDAQSHAVPLCLGKDQMKASQETGINLDSGPSSSWKMPGNLTGKSAWKGSRMARALKISSPFFVFPVEMPVVGARHFFWKGLEIFECVCLLKRVHSHRIITTTTTTTAQPQDEQQ